MRGLVGAQANDSGWPTFSGKYVEYPRFRKEWWAYRHTYHGHVREELVCRSLKEKSLASSIKILVNDIEDLREAWGTLDTCFDRPEKYIAEALEPVTKFKGYKAFDSSLLPGILAKVPANDCRQWARERPLWIGGVIEEAFWTFVDQKWRDALNVAAAEPTGWNIGSSGARTQGAKKKGPAEAKKPSHAAIHVAAPEEKPPSRGGWQEMHVC